VARQGARGAAYSVRRRGTGEGERSVAARKPWRHAHSKGRDGFATGKGRRPAGHQKRLGEIAAVDASGQIGTTWHQRRVCTSWERTRGRKRTQPGHAPGRPNPQGIAGLQSRAVDHVEQTGAMAMAGPTDSNDGTRMDRQPWQRRRGILPVMARANTATPARVLYSQHFPRAPPCTGVAKG